MSNFKSCQIETRLCRHEILLNVRIFFATANTVDIQFCPENVGVAAANRVRRGFLPTL